MQSTYRADPVSLSLLLSVFFNFLIALGGGWRGEKETLHQVTVTFLCYPTSSFFPIPPSATGQQQSWQGTTYWTRQFLSSLPYFRTLPHHHPQNPISILLFSSMSLLPGRNQAHVCFLSLLSHDILHQNWSPHKISAWDQSWVLYWPPLELISYGQKGGTLDVSF